MPEWAEELRDGFPKLKNLDSHLSTRVLQKLHRLAVPLTRLRIRGERLDNDILQAASAFKYLENLDVESRSHVGWRVTGSELISVAQNCPNLTYLHLGDYLKADDMNDANLLVASRSFRSLKFLCLQYTEGKELSFATLQSLGMHCPNLRSLRITCDVDWDYIEQNDIGVVFLELRELRILPRSRFRWSGSIYKPMKALAEKILRLAPNLSGFTMSDQHDVRYRELAHAVMSLLKEQHYKDLLARAKQSRRSKQT
ncbi:hypothetical protein DM02DRAFT_617930 [Periconia macrospinosa]|uniref:RNI-like protein n=1 Tax=Periconia macrospinosa TaxID=97972 RepID=A0A2V1DDY5_9PLEO|nr:hypothetical protein DM02DRAFT_617930 [Periconia macrospinosa]